MKFQLITQVVLIIISVIIIITVIKPKFSDIQAGQMEVTRYQKAVATVTAANGKLQELVYRVENDFSHTDRRALALFLPKNIDAITISRDIQNIVETNGLILRDISFASGDEDGRIVSSNQIENNADVAHSQSLASDGKRAMQSQQFDVEAVGSYQGVKTMLQDFERNIYPLRLIDLEFELDAENESNSIVYVYNITLETYALGDIEEPTDVTEDTN